MEWLDALKVSTLILASLGGGGGIVLGFSRLLGEKWLQDWKGEIDAKLQKLDATLKHRNYLLQRFADFELQAITECWQAARACLPWINSTRPLNSGTDEAVLQSNVKGLSDAHDKLIETIGRHEMFLSSTVVETLDSIGCVIRMELSNIRYHAHFENSWWEEGERNRNEFKGFCDSLLNQVKDRAKHLRAEATAGEVDR